MTYDLPLPITKPGMYWSQREYLAAQANGLGFTAHGTGRSRTGGVSQWFHYRLPDRCVSLLIMHDEVINRVDHAFVPDLHWIDSAAKAVAALEERA